MNDETAPKGGSETPAKAPDSSLLRSLRRRRDAADRLPPLACGHTDPLLHTRWPLGGVLHIYPRPAQRYSIVRGPLHLLLKGTEIRCHRTAVGLEVRTDRLDEVQVLADRAHWRVVVHDGELPR